MPAARHEQNFDIEPICLSDLQTPAVQTILHAWQKWCGFRSLPAKEGLVPRDLGRFMANVTVVRVLESEGYEFRMVVDAQLVSRHQNFTGMLMRDVITAAPRMGRRMKTFCDLVRNTGARAPFMAQPPETRQTVIFPRSRLAISRLDHAKMA
jgi:hypothetical protein